MKMAQWLLDELIQFVVEGRGVSAFCRELGVSRTSLWRWTVEDPTLAERLARAREAACMFIEDEIEEIADKPLGPGEGSDEIARRKLQCWAREKKLMWNQPHRYSEKHQFGGSADLPPIQLTETQRTDRIRQLLAKAAVVKSPNSLEAPVSAGEQMESKTDE